MSHRVCHLALIFCLVLSVSVLAQGPNSLSKSQMPSVVVVPAEAQPSPNFNADAATNAYLAQIPAAARARSDAYFEGGYWLILWDFLYGFVVALVLLNLRWSARMRDLAERITRLRPIHTIAYWIEYLVVTFVLGFPIALLRGLCSRTQIRFGHANVWSLDE